MKHIKTKQELEKDALLLYGGNNKQNPPFNVGDKVVKNEETWEPNDFDSWGRGIGVGIIVEPPFEMDKGEVDVRWEGGRCFEFTHQLRKVN